MQRQANEKVQHRRHRPVYLAPTAMNFQDFSSRSYNSFGDDTYEDDNSVEDLMIPLFVEIPHDENLRLPTVSPPSSGNSTIARSAFLLSPGFVPTNFEFQSTHPSRSRSVCGRFRERLYRAISWVYMLVSDFLLLIFVCIMGLFFHVEVQVVKERASRRRGRVVVQKTSERRHRYHEEYRSTDLLRPLQQQSSSTNSYLLPDDLV